MLWAAWAQNHGEEFEAELSASAAKVFCTESYRNIATEAIQIFGGAGMTWENPTHLYLKRAKSNEQILGDSIYHRERVIQIITEKKNYSRVLR